MEFLPILQYFVPYRGRCPKSKTYSFPLSSSVGTVGSYFLRDSDVERSNLSSTWTRGIDSLQLIRPNLALFWLHGHVARFVETLHDDVIISGLDRMLSTFLRTKIGTFLRPAQLVRTNWFGNPFTRGSYSFPAKNAPISDFSTIGAPIVMPPLPNIIGNNASLESKRLPRLMFAGEATHPHFYSTTHGAFESGLREAKRLAEYLGDEAKTAGGGSRAFASKFWSTAGVVLTLLMALTWSE